MLLVVAFIWVLIDVAKWADRVGFRSGQSGLQVNQVAGQNRSFLNGSIGLQVGSGQVDLYFSNFYFFE